MDLEPETWALIGVVVGAVLGGLAQILDSHLSGRRDRQRVQREIRQSVYVEFLRAGSRVNRDDILRRRGEEETHLELSDFVDGLAALQSARAELTLVAPRDTDAAGQALADRHMDIAEHGTGETRDRAATARDVFIELAKRDLGLAGVRARRGA